MDETRPVSQSETPATGASTTAPKAVAAASPPVSKAVAATILGGAVLASQLTPGQTMDLTALPAAAGPQGVGALGAIMIGFVCMFAHRGTDLVYNVMDAVENKSVKVVEVVGDNVTMAVPILMGLCLTLLIVVVKQQVAKSYEQDLKVKALREGQNLEGNVALEGQPAAPPVQRGSRTPSPAAVLVELGGFKRQAVAEAFSESV